MGARSTRSRRSLALCGRASGVLMGLQGYRATGNVALLIYRPFLSLVMSTLPVVSIQLRSRDPSNLEAG